MITLTAFLATTGGTFVVNLVSAMLKNYIKPRFGVEGMHFTVFALSIVAACWMQWYLLGDAIPDLLTLAGFITMSKWIGAVFTASIAFYEVLWKRIGLN